jgi:protease I
MEEAGGKKRVLMVIAPENFRDEEYREPREVLESKGWKVEVASTSLREARGMLGMTVKPDLLLDQADGQDYDAVVFVGGSGSSCYWDHPTAHALARQMHEAGKVVGAICIAPVTLANAGLLKGRRATCWPEVQERLKQKEALYTGNPVEVDGRVVTGSGPQAARAFGEALAQVLGS